MPKQLSYDLADCLERANPYTEIVIEISKPDAAKVLRRPDQFTNVAPLGNLVGGSVVGGISAAPSGALQMTPGSAALAAFAGEQSFYDLNKEDPQRRKKGLMWDVDPAYVRGVLRSFTARVQRVALAGFYFPLDFQLDILRVTKTPGVKQKLNAATQSYTDTAFTEYTFASVLSSPAIIKAANIVWDGAQKATLNFDLSAYGVVLENLQPNAAAPDQTGDLPRYYFILTVVNQPATNSLFRWLLDTASARTIANIGTFRRVFWARSSDDAQWVEDVPVYNDVPACSINIDSYPVQSQAAFDIDLGAVPDPASTGRFVFGRLLPPGTSATAEISYNGGGVYAGITDGGAIATAQQTYRLRVTLNSDAPHRSSPGVTALGVEYRVPVDVSVESIPTLPTRDISPPWLQANIPESKLRVLRTGIRDYLDVATVLGSTQPTTRLEADIFLASRHPAVTRDKWLRLERLTVSNRVPDETGETFTLLSYASKLKKKIPGKRETINTVHTVTAADAAGAWIRVTPALPGVGVGDNSAYDGKGYYIRVRTTSVAGIPQNFQTVVQGNTGTNQLDLPLASPMPAQLAVNDVIELHSGLVAITPIVFQNVDPADAWDQVVNAADIPPERVGLGYLPRGGKPPRVTDRAPGDLATQAKLRVTLELKEEESADELLDQLSFIMGGVWLEIEGQICFVQIHPLRALDGTITVPLPSPVAIIDARDYAGLQTPPGLEQRSTFVTAKYGVNSAAANPDSYLERVTAVGDNDAFAWLQRQDMDDVAASEIPDKISRWFYNSTDAGLYLATVTAGMPVRAQSTGMRVFPFNSVAARPTWLPGDQLVIVTDKYTDYDPSTQTALRGPLAIRGVLVQVGPLGHQLAVYVLGLAENVVQLSGGAAGDLGGVGAADVLYDFLAVEDISDTSTQTTYRVTAGVLVKEVWIGIVTFGVPAPASRWDIVRAAVAPLGTPLDGNGQLTFAIPKPAEGFVTYVQVEPRAKDLTVGKVFRAVITSAQSQAPFIELDDSESATVGTQWWRITERGLAVTDVKVQTQVGQGVISAFVAPTRSPGAVSVVRGGVLGAGEYEHDVTLDASRFSWIMPRITLANGAAPIVLGPFGFDRDKNPNIISITLTGTILTILCDTDTRSIKVANSGATWLYESDGLSLAVDVSKTGTNGAAGLGAAASDTYTITAQSDPLAYVGGGTLTQSQTQAVGGASAPPPGASWQTPGVIVFAPPANGNANAKINLFASAAPVGWTVKVYIYVGFSSSGTPTVDHTADLTPALSAPPTVATDYTYPTNFPKSANTAGTALVTMKVRADLVDNVGVVKDTRNMQTTWYSPL